MWPSQRSLAIGLAAGGFVLVASTAACWAYAFGRASAADFWFLAIPAALVPHATAIAAVCTARGGPGPGCLVGTAGVAVAGAGLLVFWVAARAAAARDEFSSLRFSQEWATTTATSWLTTQEVAALVAAFSSGLTWERRPRYALWFAFTVALGAFALFVDYTERLGASVVYEWRFTFRDLIDGRPPGVEVCRAHTGT